MVDSSNIVQIHLVFHRSNDDLKVDFPFDTENDKVDTVVSELIKECELDPNAFEELKSKMEEQINKASNMSKTTSFELLIDEDQSGDDADSSDLEFESPEYQALLDQQRREMAALLQRHKTELANAEKQLQRQTEEQHKDEDLIIFG